MGKIEPQPGIMNIALYQSGAAHVPGVDNVIKLSSNENPYGPSPKAVEAVRNAAAQMHRYPNTDHTSLRAAIGEAHDMDPDRIICGVGSDEIIHFLCQAYAGPGDEVLHTEHGFSMYKISAMAAGATPVEVKERERVTDVDALLAGCTERTRLVFIANPNNPTGTMISEAEVARLADNIPPQAILVLDGAYAEYVEGFDAGKALIDARSNVFMTRTFSKLYGLGGIRVGWGYGPREIIDVLNRIRGPFNVNGMAIAAGMAAVRDRDFVTRSIEHNDTWLPWVTAELEKLGLKVTPSVGNFVLVHFPDEDGKRAADADAYLLERGCVLRMVGNYGLPNSIRMTIGSEDANRAIIGHLKDFLEQK